MTKGMPVTLRSGNFAGRGSADDPGPFDAASSLTISRNVKIYPQIILADREKLVNCPAVGRFLDEIIELNPGWC
jgi:hypothetical protein